MCLDNIYSCGIRIIMMMEFLTFNQGTNAEFRLIQNAKLKTDILNGEKKDIHDHSYGVKTIQEGSHRSCQQTCKQV